MILFELYGWDNKMTHTIISDTLIHAVERLVQDVDTGSERISDVSDGGIVTASSYFDVDNGGVTLAVDNMGNTTIEIGFFGYGSTNLLIGPNVSPRQLGIELIKLANYIDAKYPSEKEV